MKKVASVAVVLLIGGAASTCHGQVGRPWYYTSNEGYNYGASSNPQEGMLRGSADVIRSTGAANLMNSQAMIHAEEARSRYIDNSLQWTKTYYDRKQMYREQRDEQARQERQSRELFRSRANTSPVPELSTDQLDHATGEVNWPSALQDERYAESRKELEGLLSLKAQTSSTATLSRRIHEAARRMQGDLKQQISEIPPVEYIPARRFLDGLAYAGYNPAG